MWMTTAAQQAQKMLDAFDNVGAQRFDITFTDAAGNKVGFYSSRCIGPLRAALPEILCRAIDRQHNVIVRPRSAGTTLIQLDDITMDTLKRLLPVSFLAVRTSPDNYQAWVAVADAESDFARRLRKGVGADPTASGATRACGSVNFKAKYAPNYPCVETVYTCPGKQVTSTELEALGLVAPRQQSRSETATTRLYRPGVRGWPNYRRCVENAPQVQAGGRPDISRADFTFCLLAIDWGCSIEEAATRLLQESGKARENGEAYAMRTARRAAAAIERRVGFQR
jgi:hypothetical protein